MSKIAGVFAELKAKNKKGLIPFVTAGDPHPDLTVDVMHALVKGGADVIELGVPFSDPMADGPVIQRSSERALAQGVTLKQCLANVQQFRQKNQNTPVVLMGYANPVEQMGHAVFAKAAKAAGVDGVLIVDYPPEECEEFAKQMRSESIDPIFLLAPTSSQERIHHAAQIAAGYIYYVSLRGVTGASNLNTQDVASVLPLIRQATSIPVAVGFGIRDAASAKAVSKTADAVVIGSRIVQLLEEAKKGEELVVLERFIHEIRQALDRD
ncbi:MULTISPECIES: tryptophan synthase subunit alpha [unclassified Polynucleobacter]|uniref:tryptophan synthase subunit alpha n=1 Tax=unclassified Polynucleobacter TaxID=2640945 RepID=UPI0025730602|nr:MULTISPECIES: tryptophan synthase subunit alpha [unclassified Polynucleobacter]BEI42793.1 tryptophan synthase subunit alpha [Polynucleobacter sp. HIN10]BEI44547.1 tryptophan synthase subunit alpha [Polynucleobacter sp. HIN11]